MEEQSPLQGGLELPANVLVENIRLGEMAALSARAGVGKSAVLVQIALAHLLKDQEVLHVSVGHPVRHVRRSYDDMLESMHFHFKLSVSLDTLRIQTERNRHIHSYLGHNISPKKVEKALSFLKDYAHFAPAVTIIDGLALNKVSPQTLKELKELAKTQNFALWFSALCHRTDPEPQKGKLPKPLEATEDLWDAVYKLTPKKKSIPLICLKHPKQSALNKDLRLDPSSMIILG